ncbi:AAA family ATPase [Comamonas testosteroni]|uniref:AAA family ATPase n=1 Tax=Comamonas testosteroni TaxID=285 RepID=A0A373F4U2_COMTE|nr:ATP-binding protein [Comamonas testosteroni]RGE39030.1 AAA family ATPase [Comamonas testosteroni]
MDAKIERIYKCCKAFLGADASQVSKFSQLSIYPTFLFDGYPGTGKSSVANIVYEKLKREHNIDIKRLNVDELISHNFGESSSNLRDYFNSINEEIEKNKSYCFIVMDEVDSFTTSRYQNDNESIKRILLTFNLIIDELVRSKQIYRYIIIATTNVKDNIDTSVLRRFFFNEDFNIELDKLSLNKFLKELSELTGLYLEEKLIDQIFDDYIKRKHTLGEIKSIFSKSYMKKLISESREGLSKNLFLEHNTFYEITQRQKQGG